MIFKRKGILFIIIGMLLCAITLYPMFLIVREIGLDLYINSKYRIDEVVNIKNKSQPGQPSLPSHFLTSPIEWKGNIIEVLTKDTGTAAPKSIFDKLDKEPRHVVIITIKVNGEEVSFPTEAWLRSNITKDSDFLSWLNIVRINKDSEQEQLVIIQRLADNWKRGETETQKWRILHIGQDKKVREEIFSYTERGEHLLGVKLIQVSSQSSSFIGYKSDILTYLPSYYFPLAYPFLVFVVSIIFIIIGFLRFNKFSRLEK